jgi:hypothetical protein
LACVLAFVLLAGPLQAGVDPLLPDDTQVVVTVNLRQLLDSPVIKKHGLGPAREALKGIDEVQDILDDLNFDPFKDLDQVIIASPGGAEQDRGLVIVHGHFDLAKFKARGDKAARDNPDSLKIHQVPDGQGGQMVIYEVNTQQGGGDAPLFVALPSKTVLLASPGKDYVVDALKKDRGKQRPALKNKEIRALIDKMDDQQTVAIAAVGAGLPGGALSDNKAKQALDQVEAIGGGVTLRDDLKIEVIVSAKSPDGAKQFKEAADKALRQAVTLAALAATAEPRLNPLFEIVKTLKVTARGKLVTFKGQVSAELIEEALEKNK